MGGCSEDRRARARTAAERRVARAAEIYAGALRVVCAEFRLGVADVQRMLAAAPASRPFKLGSDLREISLYIANTALGVRQRTLARVVGLSPPAVLYAIRRVEDRRDNEAFDQVLWRLERRVLEAV